VQVFVLSSRLPFLPSSPTIAGLILSVTCINREPGRLYPAKSYVQRGNKTGRNQSYTLVGKDGRLGEPDKLACFEQAVLPHLDSAYNLARWLIRNDQDAQDVVQEACLRALRSFEGFRGGDRRAWLLTIVRNSCYTWLQQNGLQELTTVFDEEIHTSQEHSRSPEALLLEKADARLVKDALEELQPEFREAIVLRELEGMSYKEIADVAGVPVGTVMSRLARARERLQRQLTSSAKRES